MENPKSKNCKDVMEGGKNGRPNSQERSAVKLSWLLKYEGEDKRAVAK